MGKFTRIIKSVIGELAKPKSYAKGEDFEEYVRNYIFPEDLYGLVSKTHDYTQNRKDFVEASLEPDYCLFDRKSERQFYVEAKFRSDYYKGAILWCKPDQFDRYKDFDKQLPVFVSIGVGGKPTRPVEVFLFPVRAVKYSKLFKSVLRDWEQPPDVEIMPQHLWNMIK